MFIKRLKEDKDWEEFKNDYRDFSKDFKGGNYPREYPCVLIYIRTEDGRDGEYNIIEHLKYDFVYLYDFGIKE